MKNITKELSQEHQNILKVIDAVINECKKIELGKDADKTFFKDVVLFIKKYADGFHHAKEEDILFKAMLENMDHMHCNPIPVMFREHTAGRQFVKGMEAALLNGNNAELVKNATSYCILLQNHIYKEDNVLYPMAENGISEFQKTEVEEKYKQVSIDNFFKTDIQSFIDGIISHSKAA
jgi:hemerythrin-like domain-containing protein